MADDRTAASRSGGSADHPPSYPDAVAVAESGQLDEAIAMLRRILAASPDHLDARVLLGVSLAEAGEPGRAEGMLRSATALDPAHVRARLGLGDLLVKLGRHREALAEYRAVLAIDPDHPTARQNVIALTDPPPGH